MMAIEIIEMSIYNKYDMMFNEIETSWLATTLTQSEMNSNNRNGNNIRTTTTSEQQQNTHYQLRTTSLQLSHLHSA